jgi:hypothetical protein
LVLKNKKLKIQKKILIKDIKDVINLVIMLNQVPTDLSMPT